MRFDVEMKLTKQKLREIIKEELERVLESDPMDVAKAAKIQKYLQNIASWMADHHIYIPEDGIKAWIENGGLDQEEEPDEMAKVLMDREDDIYDYME